MGPRSWSPEGSNILDTSPHRYQGSQPGALVSEWDCCSDRSLVLQAFGQVRFILKLTLLGDKDNKELNHPSHFRPICILPCWGKVLDKIICDRLSYYLEANKLLNIKQFGFRKNKSTILVIKNILDFHNTSREEKNITLLVSIDMSHAFNAVDWEKMKAKIFALPIPHYLKAIVCDFLQDRQVILHGISRPYNRGIPQGSCLGPILWNIFVNDLLDTNFGTNIQVQAFADDILLMMRAPASYCFSKDSVKPLQLIESWTKNNDLTINLDKTCFTILSPKNFTHIPTIKIAGNKIKFNKNLKYLGIHFDAKLNWNFHLNTVQDKINNLHQKLIRITRATWGLNPKVKKDIYLKVIERVISYGQEIWFQDKSKQNIKILQLQRIGLLNITKCYKTVATDSLQVLAGTPPLDTKLRFQQVFHRLKIHGEEIHIGDLAIQPNNFTFLKPIFPPWSRCSIKWSLFRQELPGLSVFTDGSKMNGKVGGAFVVFNHHLEVHHDCFRLSDNATVYSAELLAIKKAIEYTILNDLPVVTIISDSRSVLMAVENVNNGYHLHQGKVT
ncbi:RNA-directed DNA polymerase from mobile element jockey [Caerostris darwini]|uniref:RNA-directed DNA polymerase from mobile element jockey n=1 Tax=Caerostris darwini TaxID=1538125 RepID=A0AAV4STU3_9ARAC|nr:RNA-directed DNA polymerase from mobile element jockey [Caerostris darwini]